MPPSLKVVIIKPSKYMLDGSVERFHWGFMPNSTVPHIRSMVPPTIHQQPIETRAIDEYVYGPSGGMSLVAIILLIVLVMLLTGRL